MLKKINRITIYLLLIAHMLFPFEVFAYSDYILAGGQNIGIELNSNGVLIVGTYLVDGVDIAKNANLQIGDKIISINGEKISSIEEMLSSMNHLIDNNQITIVYQRGSQILSTNLTLILDDTNIYKTGLYVKDSINGVGTLTFIDPNTKIYGALGHEILEKTTGQKLEIKDGKIYSSIVTGIVPSQNGNPGEKNARYNVNDIFGNIIENTPYGIFGIYQEKFPTSHLYKVASQSDIKLGKASILTVINGDEVENFSIDILKINSNNTSTKNFLFEVTDKKLLSISGGIVQGMSGSPVIQDDKIIGAVTHVVVDDCTKGYGIFITNMLEEAEN